MTPAQKKVIRELLNSLGKEEKPDGHGNYKTTPSPLYSAARAIDDTWESVVNEITKENESGDQR